MQTNLITTELVRRVFEKSLNALSTKIAKVLHFLKSRFCARLSDRLFSLFPLPRVRLVWDLHLYDVVLVKTWHFKCLANRQFSLFRLYVVLFHCLPFGLPHTQHIESLFIVTRCASIYFVIFIAVCFRAIWVLSRCLQKLFVSSTSQAKLMPTYPSV